MTNKKLVRTIEELEDAFIDAIVKSAGKISKKSSGLVRILDIASGDNKSLSPLINGLVEKSIDYEIVLLDTAPYHLHDGYNRLKENIPPKELENIRCVLSDAANLRKKINKFMAYIWPDDLREIDDIIEIDMYRFLKQFYRNGDWNVKFEDESFDIVMGNYAYRSIENYPAAARECARVLKKGGYHIFREFEIEDINGASPRSEEAMRRMNEFNELKIIQETKRVLDPIMDPITILSTRIIYPHENPPNKNNPAQVGDIIRESVLIYQK
ncbi:MAG: methyltransferase domain-containing protein [Nanoarchaeota archaeon]